MRIFSSAKNFSCLLRLYVLGAYCACATGSIVALTQSPSVAAPNVAASSAALPMVRVLLNRARSLAARGEEDTAIQVWQQVLLADPENSEALAGVATAYRQVGNLSQSEIYVSRLRQVNPSDPHIASIEQMPAQMPRQQQLQQAGRLAMRGQAAQAMEIYRNLYGDQPPDGDVALAYYETESALPAGKDGAITGLRALTARYPAVARYAIALGRILTYDSATRAEGIAMLQPYAATDANAARALQQASQWDTQASTTATPSSEAASHPASGIAQTPAEDSAFQALHDGKMRQAEQQFRAILADNPADGPAQAGMGMIRLQQQDFGAAQNNFEQAIHHGVPAILLHKPLITARYWKTMQQAEAASKHQQWSQAESDYRAALALQPNTPEALDGLASTMLANQQGSEAIPIYRQLLRLQPVSVDGGRGLLAAQIQTSNIPAALATLQQIPALARASLLRDSSFLQSEAVVEDANGQTTKALETLRQALALSPAEMSPQARTHVQLQDAALLLRTGQLLAAQQMYQQVLAADTNNAQAWQGSIEALHQAGDDGVAWQKVQSMPPEIEATLQRDPGFLSTLSAIAASQNQLAPAQEYLQQAMQQIRQAGKEPPSSLEMQAAGLYLQQKQPRAAADIYRHLLATSSLVSGNYDAWLGLFTALHMAGKDRVAAQQAQALPATMQTRLNNDPQFLLTMAGVDDALGNTQHAITRLERVEAIHAAAGQPTDVDVQIELCWLFYRAHQGDRLLPRLEELSHRAANFSVAQQRQLAQIWILWSLRRTDRYRTQREFAKAVYLLEAAHAAFPQNARVRGTLAGAYIEAHEPKKTVALYADKNLRLATPEDVRAAIGAAMASAENQKAERWLRQARQRYPQNPALLVLYAKWDETQDQDNRAIQDLRSALELMPQDYQVDRPTTADLAGKATVEADHSADFTVPLEDRFSTLHALDVLGAALLRGNAAPASSRGLSKPAPTKTPQIPEPLMIQASAQLAEIETRLSPWVAAIPYLNHRSGTQWLEQMIDIEAPVAVSTTWKNRMRITGIAQPVYLSDGAQTSADLLPVGTLPAGTPAAAQIGRGMAGVLQLATRNVDLSAGTSPVEFFIAPIVGSAALRVPRAHLTLTFARDNVRDSELSYAGLRNPDTAADPNPAAAQVAGKVWGGVVSNLGGLDWSHGSARRGIYFTGSAGVLTGQHVQTNTEVRGDTGAYFRLLKKTSAGNLMLATNFFGMHYAHDELYFTYGQGGYFSPEYFLLGNFPLTWTGHHGRNFHYDLEGTLGAQRFHQSSAPYFPLDPALQTTHNPANPVYVGQTTTSLNYGAQADLAWLLGRHWYLGAFASANNSSNYNQQVGGISLHYALRRQHPREESPTGIFPYSGMNTLKLP